MSVPGAVVVMLTLHDAVAPVPARVRIPLGAKVTVPVGVVGVVLVSVTVAVQLVTWLAAIVLGLHDTVVVVVCNCWNVTGPDPVLAP